MNRFPKVRTLDTNYAYAAGVVSAKETKLFDSKHLEQLISSKDGRELIAALHDSDYGHFFRQLDSPHRFEETLEDARIELYNEIQDLIDNSELLNVLRARFDFHNITVLLKGKIAEEEFLPYCSRMGTIPLDRLASIFEEERYNRLPDYLKKATEQGIEAYYAHHHNPQLLNIRIDSAMADFLTSNEESDYLRSYYRVWVDVTNLKTILRLFFLNRYKELAEYALLSGGFIASEKILSWKLQESVESLEGFYRGSIYADLLKYRASFSELEKACEHLLLLYIKSVAYESIGVEPIICYLFLKENEIRNLRLIFIGKINGVKDEEIKERLII